MFSYGEQTAVFSVIDWPVAAAIGIGTEIAGREGADQPPRRAIEA
jgi:hypothetical protein